ncbi:inter-alpha-trypsin inhibitor heavy chain H6 [Dromiciops gliroides]|uniref:inter-alpha-trypsin inhibitor heavy chain H6 n=1 Tax=Dromiciops gliroides TaxID=33562 RepID=UPI001CC5816F|nr:inter-alpha-trypsin inhibitor heavy chain H6 [Dromiciops gliroides]
MKLLRAQGCLGSSLAIFVALSFRQVLGSLMAHRELTVTRFSIRSTIVSRYAHTQVVSVMTNPHSEAQEAIFDLDLPSMAFISNFTMTINGKVYTAEVKEKHQAKKMYEEARKQGQTAAHVASQDDEVKKFKISTSVAVGGEVTFALTYEELLPRLLGKYQHAVSVRPGQVVLNLSVEVTVSERTGIDYIHVLPLRTSHLLTNAVRGEADLPTSTRIEKEETCARVTFTPTLNEQAAYSSRGIMGDFVIQYDVTMKDVIGDVQIYDGYFVHYLAPRDLPRMQKTIIFVIDVSGSMTGTKLKQTKKAMHVILGDLCPEDHFNIVTFSDIVHIWKATGSIQATPPNIQRAKAYIGRMQAGRWTDMNAALLAAASILKQSITGPSGEARLVIFLTDGEPTAGVTSPARILANAQRALAGQAALFGLALGDDADLPLLRRLSLENRGTAHRIREDQDAALQLKGFYDRIASPLLADIHLHYQAGRAGGANPLRSYFPNYFGGSELVVVGQLGHREPELRVHLEARGPHNHLLTAARSEKAASGREPAFGCLSHRELKLGQGFLQRLWAYVTIQGLLEARLGANDSATRRLLGQKALNLSLHFHFVTPLTSLVVVKPEEEDRGEQGPHPALPAPGKSSRLPLLTGPTEPLLQGAKLTNTSPRPSATAKAGNPRATQQNPTPPGPWVQPHSAHPSSVKPTVSSFPETGSLSPPRAGPAAHPSSVTPSLLTSPQAGALLHPKANISSRYNPGSLAPPRSDFLTTPKASTPIRPSPNISSALNQPLSSPSPPKAVSPSLTRTGSLFPLKPDISFSSSIQKYVSPGPPKPGSLSPPNVNPPNSNSSDFPKPSPQFPPQHNPSSPKADTLSPSKFSSQFPARPVSPDPPNLTFNPHQPSSSSPPKAQLLSQPKPNIPSQDAPPKWDQPTSHSLSSPSLLRPATLFSRNVTASPDILIAWDPSTSSPPQLASPSLPQTGVLLYNLSVPKSQSFPRPSSSSLSILNHPPPYNLSSVLVLPEEPGQLLEILPDSRFSESLKPPAIYTFPNTPRQGSRPGIQGKPQKSPSVFTFSSSVDGDPHFEIRLPNSESRICFTVDGRPGDTLQLIGDHETGLHVSGHLLGAPPKPGGEQRTRTYFDKIVVAVRRLQDPFVIRVSLHHVSLEMEGMTKRLSWDQPLLFLQHGPGLELILQHQRTLTIRLSLHFEFLIKRHRDRHPTPLRLPHLGFYMVNGHGLSRSAQGLLGQFQHTDLFVKQTVSGAWLERSNGPSVPLLPVIAGKDLLSGGPCWRVKHQDVGKLLGSPYKAFVL